MKTGGELFTNRIEKGQPGLPIYSVTMNDGLVKRSSLDRKVDDITVPGGNKRARVGDLAYNMMRMWQGALGVATEECVVSPAYVVLAPKPGVHSHFYASYFKLPRMLKLFTSHSRGLTEDRLRLYYDDFSQVPVMVPGEDEQRHLADLLASIDASISVQFAKLNALARHKRGLMQGLFPRPEST